LFAVTLDARTALVIPVPEAAGIVKGAEIALLDPFLAHELVDDGVLAELGEFFSRLVPFPFVLGETAQFPSGASYLPPQPVATFRRITHDLRRDFPELVGHATTLDTFVPHLPVPDGTAIPRPFEAHAREAQLVLRTDNETRTLAVFRFGTSAA
jgi:hypothetical protein